MIKQTANFAPRFLTSVAILWDCAGIVIAVVVLFYVGTAGFGDSFVGVDAFFVLSGFLITDSFFAKEKAGQISLSRFYT